MRTSQVLEGADTSCPLPKATVSLQPKPVELPTTPRASSFSLAPVPWTNHMVVQHPEETENHLVHLPNWFMPNERAKWLSKGSNKQLAEGKGMWVTQPGVSDVHCYNSTGCDSTLSKILLLPGMKNIQSYSSNRGPQNSLKWDKIWLAEKIRIIS